MLKTEPSTFYIFCFMFVLAFPNYSCDKIDIEIFVINLPLAEAEYSEVSLLVSLVCLL